MNRNKKRRVKNINKNNNKQGKKQKAFARKHAFGEVITGVLQGSGKGYAFLIPDDNSGDLFVAARDLNGARHGDRVECVKVSANRGSGEGEVKRILSRGFDCVVGNFDGKYVVSSERGFGSVRVDLASSKPAKVGEKVVGMLVDKSEPLKCRITEVLGHEGETEADVMGVIRSHNLFEFFPQAVLRDAAKLPSEVLEQQTKGRRDFRGDDVVTIDGETSKDFDDAISVVKTPTGYRLSVHIADVAEYVSDNSKLDLEALKRGTSVYFADRVLPMLPEKLSNGICSLNEGVDRLCLSCIMDFDGEGKILSHEICEGVMRSKARMTYTEMQAVMDGDAAMREKYASLTPMLDNADKLAHLLNARRVERGSVEFDIPECEILMNKDGTVKDVVKRERIFAYKLIEEFMLAANETVAEHFNAKQVPFVYRVHADPPEEKVNALNNFLGSMGLSIAEKPTPADYAELVANLDDGVKAVVNRVALRSMSKADYRPECLGHFGLAAQYYCHFTSPIRRYPDLAIHRIIKCILRGGNAEKKYREFVHEASARSSERERIAEEAERKVDDVLKAKFMADKVGNEYPATVSGVTEWGIFAELDNTVEGMIRTENLPGSGYVYDEQRMLVSNGQNTYRIGDKINIVVEATNFDKISFLLKN